jgi:hypothetical protein
VPGATWEKFGRHRSFVYGAITRYGATFQTSSTGVMLCNSLGVSQDPLNFPATPYAQRLRAYTRKVWAGPRSLATTRGVAFAFLSSSY